MITPFRHLYLRNTGLRIVRVIVVVVAVEGTGLRSISNRFMLLQFHLSVNSHLPSKVSFGVGSWIITSHPFTSAIIIHFRVGSPLSVLTNQPHLPFFGFTNSLRGGILLLSPLMLSIPQVFEQSMSLFLQNRTQSYFTELSREQREGLEELYSLDFEMFGYSAQLVWNVFSPRSSAFLLGKQRGKSYRLREIKR